MLGGNARRFEHQGRGHIERWDYNLTMSFGFSLSLKELRCISNPKKVVDCKAFQVAMVGEFISGSEQRSPSLLPRLQVDSAPSLQPRMLMTLANLSEPPPLFGPTPLLL
jgi:hypothetical protein